MTVKEPWAAHVDSDGVQFWRSMEHAGQAEWDVKMERARAQRAGTWGPCVTYSRKVFIPLTNLCRDTCGYCTFAKQPGEPGAGYLTPDEVMKIVRQGERLGCKEALFSLGERPELRYLEAAEMLAKLGHATTLDYVIAMCERVLRESTLIPHVNAGIGFEEVAHRAQVAWDRGATEVCIQGGLHPELPADYYRDLVRAVKHQVPGMHVHAFSPFEIWFGAHKRKLSTAEFLLELKEAGLGSIPGTAAEILDVEIRRQLTRNKLTTEAWVDTVKTAHRIGLRGTSTMMYGHIDSPWHWAAHMALLREIQRETGGFTEFVPLGFVHSEAPLYVDHAIPGVRAGATAEEHVRVHATARLMLAGWIDNIQVSWVKLGPEMARALLNAGVNDIGGTLMDETISRSAGANFGEELTPREMVDLIRDAGRPARRRGTLYQTLETYDDHDPEDLGPLKARAVKPTRFVRGRTNAHRDAIHV